MKNVSKLALLITAASILQISCSQVSNKLVTRTFDHDEIYLDQGSIEKSEPVNEENYSTGVKGYSSLQTEMIEFEDTMVEDNTQMTHQQPIPTSDDEVIPEDSYVTFSTTDINVNIGYTNQIKGEFSSKPDIYQYINNSGSGGGQSSNGVPFWLIVVCAIIIPPLGIALKFGITDKFWICLALTLIFWVPGMIYALIHVL